MLDQAIGLTMYDPGRYAELGRGASQQYLPALLSICPEDWSDQRKLEVVRDDPRRPCAASSSTGWPAGTPPESRPGSRPWCRALEREEAAGE